MGVNHRSARPIFMRRIRMIGDSQQLAGLKREIDRGEYGIDPVAVADALLARLRSSGPLDADPVVAAEPAVTPEIA